MRNVLIFTSLLALCSCGVFKKADPIIVEKIVLKLKEKIHKESVIFFHIL